MEYERKKRPSLGFGRKRKAGVPPESDAIVMDVNARDLDASTTPQTRESVARAWQWNDVCQLSLESWETHSLYMVARFS